MIRALFLGSGGRIGTLLRAVWTSTEVSPIWHARENGDVSFDITADTGALDAAISGCDVVVNLAGVTHHGDGGVGTANTDLARYLLDHAGGKPMFLMSSAAVYGRTSGVLNEATHPDPISAYGHDKARMEAVAEAHAAKSIVLRLGNVAGADALLGVLRERYVLDKFPDGTYPARSYIGPKMLAHVLVELIKTRDNLPKLLNVAAQPAVSMADLLRAAGKLWDDKVAASDAIALVKLDTGLLESLVDMPTDAGTADAIVADWQSTQSRAGGLA